MRTSWRKKKMLHGPNSVLMRTDHSSPAQRCMWLSTPINNHVKIIGNRSTLLINLNSTARWNLVHKVPPHINEDMHKDILLLVGNLSFICPKLLREHRRCPRNTRKTWHTVRLPQNTCFHVWPQVVILEVHLSCVWSELLEFAPLIQLHFLLLESMACLCVSESVCVSARMCSGSCMMEDAEMEPRWCESPLPSCIWSFIRLRSLSLSPPFGILTNPLAITLRPLLSFVPAGTNMPFGWRISSPSKTLI